MMTQREPFNLEIVAPVFPAADLDTSLQFYTGRLLFSMKFKWADEVGEPDRYAILENGRCEIHLSSDSEAPAASAYVFVDNIDAYHDVVRERGARITCSIANQPWDMREFEVTDPNGNRLIFGEHLSRKAERADA